MTKREWILKAADFARGTLPEPEGKTRIVKKDGDNADIVRAVLDTHAKYKSQAAAFSKFFHRKDPRKSLVLIWTFLKFGIEYRLDPDGHQWTKAPAATFYSGFADCKSLAIFAASILRGLGLKYSFRFVSFSTEPTPTHVYIIVHLGREDVPLDPVFTHEGKEKPFTFKQDYPMNISEISGFTEVKNPVFPANIEPENVSEGLLTLLIHRQRLALKAQKAAEVAGIGSTQEQIQTTQLEVANDLVQNWGNPQALQIITDQHAEGAYKENLSGIGTVEGIGAARQTARQARREQRESRQRINKTTGRGSGQPLTRVVETLKRAGEAAIKAVTVIPRLAMRAVLEVTLPKAAPAFLYIFVNTPEAIKALPKKAAEKRQKAMQVFNFITDGLGMKEEHVKGLLRNGILKKTGKEPEQVIREQLKGKQVAGIGLISEIIDAVLLLVKKIAEAKGKKGPAFSASDMPSPDDFAAMSETEKSNFSKSVNDQPKPEDTAPEAPGQPVKRGICSK